MGRIIGKNEKLRPQVMWKMFRENDHDAQSNKTNTQFSTLAQET
jgi:hypothetical protein